MGLLDNPPVDPLGSVYRVLKSSLGEGPQDFGHPKYVHRARPVKGPEM